MFGFGRTMVIVGCLAALGLLATGLQGYQGAAEGDALRTHVLLGMGAVLLFVLAHAWVLFYLLGATRVLEEASREAGRDDLPAPPPFPDFRSRVLPPLLAAVAVAFTAFATGPGVYARWAPLGLHATLLWVALALQLWAARAEWQALTAAGRTARSRRG
ncbi:MAG: hypothetical protein ACLF0P_15320 [Thermoanaerobaculia bacterium]